MRCGKPEHQLGQKCPAKNAKCLHPAWVNFESQTRLSREHLGMLPQCWGNMSLPLKLESEKKNFKGSGKNGLTHGSCLHLAWVNFECQTRSSREHLGMINCLTRYSALSAHLTAPLSALTHQAADYKPGKVHFENFNRLKLEFSNMKALPYFDVNAETTLQMDASKKGLRVCLIQKGKVIHYVSRALTKTEQNHQNLE